LSTDAYIKGARFAAKNGKIFVDAPYEFRESLKMLTGARWNPDLSCWVYPSSPSIAYRLSEIFKTRPTTANDEFKELVRAGECAMAAAHYKDAEDLPQPPVRKTDLWRHQLVSYHMAMAQDATMLALDMGCGKSLCAISVAQNMPASRVLVLCPKSVVSVWPRELDKHAAVCYRVWAVRRDSWTVDRKSRHLKRFLEEPAPAFVVVNYDSAWREGMRQVLLKQKWDLVICDESHRIKGHTAKASKFAAQLTRVSRKRICLTGTPLPHSPMDAFAQYRFLDPGIYGDSFPKFRAEYAIMGGYLNKQIVKYINPERFNKKFYSIAYRVMADDVLDLPEFVDEPRTMELSGESKRIYRELATEFVARVKDGEVTANNALVHMLRLQQVTGGCVPTDEGEAVVVGTDKRQLLGEVIEDLPVGEPFVVFGRFHHDLDAIREECEGRGLTCGELSGRRNDLASWQDGHSDVLIIQLQAGGVGVDVTRARVAIYYSLDFNLGNYLQSRARIRRPGQSRSGLWIHLVAEGTIDEKVYRALEKRQQVVEWVLGNPESILEEAA